MPAPARLALAAILLALTSSCADDVEVISDRAYDSRFGAATTMDVYLPPARTELRPALIWVHGGGWKLFSKEVHDDHALRLARRGYVVASINYRLGKAGVFPANVQDVVCALSYLRAHSEEFGLDPARVAMAGYSAGGHLVSLVGVSNHALDLSAACESGPTTAPQAVISGAGPTDMRTLPQVDTVIEYMGGTIEALPESYRLASPQAHLSSNDPPFLFVHGEDDLFVALEQSIDMRNGLRDLGVEARLLEVPDGGHINNLGSDLGRSHLAITSVESPEAWAAIEHFLADTIGEP